ncbi:MAG: aminotransferase class I/II-fold pyridoxal phosphate-dependent enzyme, partial [Firmicutes bacterium]|nr:aminotransferase class I/II-fold pyridoxal phosphate-dependent enzyme [Bacillota bacterium]
REFERLGLPYVPTQTNFLIVDVKGPSTPVYQALLRQGVIVRQGTFFGLPTMLRVSIGTMEENRRFIQALEKVLPGNAS